MPKKKTNINNPNSSGWLDNYSEEFSISKYPEGTGNKGLIKNNPQRLRVTRSINPIDSETIFKLQKNLPFNDPLLSPGQYEKIKSKFNTTPNNTVDNSIPNTKKKELDKKARNYIKQELTPEASIRNANAKKRVEADFKESIDFMENYFNSPRYHEMLSNSTEDPYLHHVFSRDRLNNLFTTSVFSKNNDEGNPNTYGYSNGYHGDISILPKGWGDKYTMIHELSHSTDRQNIPFFFNNVLGDLGFKTRFNPTKKFFGFNNYNSFENERLIPDKDLDKILLNQKTFDKKYHLNQNDIDEENFNSFYRDYVGQPTEVRARLMEIRKGGADNKIFNPFKEKVTPESYKKLKNYFFKKDQEDSPIFDLEQLYDENKLIQLLNEVSQNTENNDLPMAKNGGKIYNDMKKNVKKFSGGGDVKNLYQQTKADIEKYFPQGAASSTIKSLEDAQTYQNQLKLLQHYESLLNNSNKPVNKKEVKNVYEEPSKDIPTDFKNASLDNNIFRENEENYNFDNFPKINIGYKLPAVQEKVDFNNIDLEQIRGKEFNKLSQKEKGSFNDALNALNSVINDTKNIGKPSIDTNPLLRKDLSDEEKLVELQKRNKDIVSYKEPKNFPFDNENSNKDSKFVSKIPKDRNLKKSEFEALRKEYEAKQERNKPRKDDDKDYEFMNPDEWEIMNPKYWYGTDYKFHPEEADINSTKKYPGGGLVSDYILDEGGTGSKSNKSKKKSPSPKKQEDSFPTLGGLSIDLVQRLYRSLPKSKFNGLGKVPYLSTLPSLASDVQDKDYFGSSMDVIGSIPHPVPYLFGAADNFWEEFSPKTREKFINEQKKAEEFNNEILNQRIKKGLNTDYGFKFPAGGYLNYQEGYKGFGVGPELYQDNSYFRSVMPDNIENMEEQINQPSVFSGINNVLSSVNQGVNKITGLMSNVGGISADMKGSGEDSYLSQMESLMSPFQKTYQSTTPDIYNVPTTSPTLNSQTGQTLTADKDMLSGLGLGEALGLKNGGYLKKYQNGGDMDMLPVGSPEYIHKSNVFHENYNPVPRVHFSDDTTPFDMGVNLNDLVNMDGGRIKQYAGGGFAEMYGNSYGGVSNSPRLYNANTGRATLGELQSATSNDFLNTKVRHDRQKFADNKVDWGFMNWAKDPVSFGAGLIGNSIVGDITGLDDVVNNSWMGRSTAGKLGSGYSKTTTGLGKVAAGVFIPGQQALIADGIGDIGQGTVGTIGSLNADSAMRGYDKSGYISGKKMTNAAQDFESMMNSSANLFGNIGGVANMANNMGGMNDIIGKLKGGQKGMKGFGNIMGNLFMAEGGKVKSKKGWLDQL